MIGRTLGSYEITAKLGEGGMGEVYRASDSRLKRDVAIKVLPAAFIEDPERLARFEREAQLLAQLQHPNIASIYGLEDSEGTRALVMELVEGPTLAERLEQGNLPLEECLAIARQVAEALEEAHEKGIIHRDLKPQNIKAPQGGKVKVLDFGLAKALDPTLGHASVADLARSPTLLNSPTLTAVPGTQLGVILGTAAYMAPEQARGSAVDKRADIWAFGVVLYEMLVGISLFSAETVTDTLAGVLKTEIDFSRLPVSTPPAIRRLLRRCLVRDPRNRLHDIADARIVLVETLTGGGEPESSEAHATATPRWLSLPLAGLAAAILVIGGYLVGHRDAPVPDAVATSSSPRFEKLTSQPGLELNPALSPDGKTLYFAATHAEREDLDIYFTPVGGTKPIDLTADSHDDDSYPAVAPDGRQIAFHSDRGGGGIFLMGSMGESVRRLVDGCFDPAWSPDGNRIACTTCPADDPFNRPCYGEVQIVEIATGTARKLETGDVAAPSWSPDGRRLAYWGLSAESGLRDLWTVAVDGGAPVKLTDDLAVDWNPLWSADGTAIDFLSDRGGAPNLWRLAIDPASGRPLGEPRSLVLPTELASEFRRSGDRWAYVSRSLRTTIDRYTFDPEGLAVLGPGETIVDTTGRASFATISPDGRTVAYSTIFPHQDLFVVEIAGGAPVQLTNDRVIDRLPTWDPNGERILFMSNRGERYDMWAIRPDGSGLEQLTAMTEESRWKPSLSPDRKRLAAISEKGLTVFDATVPPPWSQFERFCDPGTESTAHFDGSVWSMDGSSIAGFVGYTKSRRIAYWSFADRELHELDANGIALAWLPDQRRLVAFEPAAGLLVINIETGETTPVVGNNEEFGVFVSFSDDLRTFVSLRNHEQADIWLAERIE